jgi:hypothetical protein
VAPEPEPEQESNSQPGPPLGPPPQQQRQPPPPQPPPPPQQALGQISDELLLELLLARCGARELARLECTSARFWRRCTSLPCCAPEEGDAPTLGTAVHIRGLTSEAGSALNGRAGRVVGEDAETGRVVVAVEGVERKKRLARHTLHTAASLAEAAADAALRRHPERWRVWRRRGEGTLQLLRGLELLAPLRRVGCGSMHTVLLEPAPVAAPRRVWTCGLDSHGQLGRGSVPGAIVDSLEQQKWGARYVPWSVDPRGTHIQSMAATPQAVRPYLGAGGSAKEDDEIVSVGAGGSHTMALSKHGELYSWGAAGGKAGGADFGVLGHGGGDARRWGRETRFLDVPFRVAADDTSEEERRRVMTAVQQVGAAQLVASKRAIGLPLGAKGRVALVSMRDSHAAAVTVTGELYTWGSDEHGQLGMGSSMPEPCIRPRRVFSEREEYGVCGGGGGHGRGWNGARVVSRRGCSFPANASGCDPHRASISSRFGQVDVACGSYSTVVVGVDGRLSMSGRACASQTLGADRGTPYFVHVPVAGGALASPSAASEDRIVGISAGQDHFLAHSGDGKLWSWGRVPGVGGGVEKRPARVLGLVGHNVVRHTRCKLSGEIL